MSAEYLKQLLKYDPETGVFVWIGHRDKEKIGTSPTKIDGGYLRIWFQGRQEMAHRLAFLYMTGEIPKCDVDHINGNRIDNRWINLREGSRSFNMQNLKKAMKNNKVGLLGVSKVGNKFQARISTGRKQIHIGLFDTAEIAHAAYIAKKRQLHDGGML